MNHIETIIKAQAIQYQIERTVRADLEKALGYRVLICYHDEGNFYNENNDDYYISIWKAEGEVDYKERTAKMVNYSTGRHWDDQGDFTSKELNDIEEILYASR